MNVNLGTLANLINAGTTIRNLVGNACGNPTAFNEIWNQLGPSQRGQFLQALDNIQRETRVLSLVDISLQEERTA